MMMVVMTRVVLMVLVVAVRVLVVGMRTAIR